MKNSVKHNDCMNGCMIRYLKRLKLMCFFFEKKILHSAGPFRTATLKKHKKPLSLAFEANTSVAPLILHFFSNFGQLWCIPTAYMFAGGSLNVTDPSFSE